VNLLADEESAFKELISSTVEGISESLKGKSVGVLGVIEFELSVVTKKVGGGKVKLILAEAGGKYEKEEISKIKFSIGDKRLDIYKHFGWKH
jgi:hypothetical protein